MPRTGAERQQAFRDRQVERLAVLEAEAATLRHQLGIARGDLETANAEIERLGEELSPGATPRCPECRGELACPRCYRSGDF